MSVNEKLEQALEGLADGNIWALSCPPDQAGDEYITYNPELEIPVLHGDDEDLEWEQTMQVHWFKKEDSKRAVNYIQMRKELRKRLRENGFSVSEIQTFHEKDTGYTHLCISCGIAEEV